MSSHLDAADQAVEHALALGARYADARVMHRRTESMSARNGAVQALDQGETLGIGVRALVGSSWGFFATPRLDPSAVRAAGRQAVEIARASSRVPGKASMIPADPEVGSWASRCEVDPLQVPVSDKGDLLTAATAEMRAQGADIATGLYRIWDTRKWFVSSEGHRVDQRIRECGGGISATAVGERETQVRSHPSRRGQYGTRGWELVTELDLAAHASRIADEAQALLRAPQCPSGQTFTTCVVVFSKGRRAGHAGGRAPGCRRRSRPLHHRGASVGTG